VNSPKGPPTASLPLVLDLDGTVLKTDLFLETLVLAVKRRPLVIFQCLWWLIQGRAVLKRALAERTQLRVDLLPLNQALVAFAAERHAAGHPVYIASAADADLAGQAAARLGFVTDVLASDGRRNLKGSAKAAALAERFPDGFLYAGDSAADVPVWRASAGAVFAGRSRRVAAAAAKAAPLAASLPQEPADLRCWLRALRIHQWAKNVLVFVPLFLSGQGADPQAWLRAGAAFLAMGLVSSSTYLINDAVDLADDRTHPTKKRRPLASGALPLKDALAAAPLGIAAGLALAAVAAGPAGFACLCLYLGCTLLYSFGLKRIAMVDVMIIGGLFTVRLLLGAVAVAAPLRPWLFVFAMFLFTALALAKRSAEIVRLGPGGGRVGGRGYFAADGPTVTAFGVSSSVAAVLVLVLYILDEAFKQCFYGLPQMLWAAPIALTLWLGRIWLLCGRGEMDDDPVAFAVGDPASLGLAAGVVAAAALAVVL